MYSFNLIPIVIALLVATVVALPHDLMVNDEFTRDVGVVYPDNNFTGAPLYLMLHKQGRKCEAIVGLTVRSVQICVPATCILYESTDCTSSSTGNDHYFQGPVDVATFNNETCHSYTCGTVEEMKSLVGDATPIAVNAEGGHWGVVGL